MKRYNSIAIMIIMSIVIVIIGGCAGKTQTGSAETTAAPTPEVSASTTPADATPTPVVSSSTPVASPVPSGSTEKAVKPEKNPPGDIPDSQVFIKYSSLKGVYSMEVPEGWARTEQETDVSFINKFDGVKATVENADTAPTTESIKTNQAAEKIKTGKAVKVEKIEEVKIGNDKAIKVTYTSNSEPDAVTNKQLRLYNESYYFYKAGKLATLTVWAPMGADNVDQWKRMSESFRWDAK